MHLDKNIHQSPGTRYVISYSTNKLEQTNTQADVNTMKRTTNRWYGAAEVTTVHSKKLPASNPESPLWGVCMFFLCLCRFTNDKKWSIVIMWTVVHKCFVVSDTRNVLQKCLVLIFCVYYLSKCKTIPTILPYMIYDSTLFLDRKSA